MLAENVIASGSVKIANNGSLVLHSTPASSIPANPDTGSMYLQTSSSGSVVMIYTGIFENNGWEVVGSQVASNIAFKYRQVINYAYVAGGYINASPWKTVHKTTVATDQTLNIGDLMDYPLSYSSGACSKSILFLWSVNTDGLWKSATTVADTFTSAVNMFTETNYAHQSKFDLVNQRDDCGCMFKETEYAYIFGGYVAPVEKFNLTNESMYASVQSSITSTLGCSAFSDENYGYGYGEESGIKMIFATDTIQSSPKWASSGQQKGISSKNGYGYCGNEGQYNGGYNLRTWQLSTDTNIGNVAKPHPNCGEENFTMGQDWQYMLGCYDGTGQNNVSWKFYYATRSGVVNPAGLSPYAHAGQSSGHCGWRS